MKYHLGFTIFSIKFSFTFLLLRLLSSLSMLFWLFSTFTIITLFTYVSIYRCIWASIYTFRCCSCFVKHNRSETTVFHIIVFNHCYISVNNDVLLPAVAVCCCIHTISLKSSMTSQWQDEWKLVIVIVDWLRHHKLKGIIRNPSLQKIITNTLQ